MEESGAGEFRSHTESVSEERRERKGDGGPADGGRKYSLTVRYKSVEIGEICGQ